MRSPRPDNEIATAQRREGKRWSDIDSFAGPLGYRRIGI